MKHFFYFLLCITFLQSHAQGLYDVEHVTEIRITFAESNWDNIMDDFYFNYEDERLIGTVSVNGVVYDSSGVQFKGNSTYSPNNKKNPLNIKLDHIRDQNYQGWETIKLGSGRNDPSAIREVMSYELLRNYTEAPLSNFAKVFINDKFYGVFSSTESIDGDFQERYLHADDDNVRVKCNPESVFGNGSSLSYIGEDSTDYYEFYEMKSDHGWKELIKFCDDLNVRPDEMDKFLDVDRALWMLAFNNVVVNLDSYTGPFRQNYYMIKDDHDRMKSVVWDLNMSYGSFSMIGSGGQGGGELTKMQNMDPYLRENDSNWPLIKIILSNPTYKRMYIAHCKTMLEEQINSGLYADRGQKFQDLIAPDVELDLNSTYTYAKFLANLNSTVSGSGGGGGAGFCGITQLMESRKEYLNNHEAFTALPPVMSELTYPAHINISSTFTVTAKIINQTNTFLAFRNFPSELFTKVQLSDDGLNNDGIAGDGIYGYIFEGGIDRPIQFFIYTENEDAGIFSPQRAEHEYHTISLSVDGLVINEIMPSNSETIQDQDGEFDDWIELYNNSDVTINLAGYTISDKPAEPDKWVIPGGSIGPKSYIIIWADEDQEQTGLHCNFKLSATGETVVLSDPSGAILDQVSFPIVGDEKTYGRYPNGTGEWRELDPTYNAENNITLATVVTDPGARKVYPNPFSDFIRIEQKEPVTFVRLFDVNGKVVYRSESTSKDLDLSYLNKGVYFLEINHNKAVKIIK